MEKLPKKLQKLQRPKKIIINFNQLSKKIQKNGKTEQTKKITACFPNNKNLKYEVYRQ